MWQLRRGPTSNTYHEGTCCQALNLAIFDQPKDHWFVITDITMQDTPMGCGVLPRTDKARASKVVTVEQTTLSRMWKPLCPLLLLSQSMLCLDGSRPYLESVLVTSHMLYALPTKPGRQEDCYKTHVLSSSRRTGLLC